MFIWFLVLVWVVQYGVSSWGHLVLNKGRWKAPRIVQTPGFRFFSDIGYTAWFGVPALLFSQFEWWGAAGGLLLVLVGGIVVPIPIRYATARVRRAPGQAA